MQRHLRTLGGGLAAILLTIALLHLGADAIRGRETSATPEFTLETPDMADVPGGDPDDADTSLPLDETVPPVAGPDGQEGVRAVDPGQFGLSDEVTAQPLERVKPRLPLSEPVEREVTSASTVLRHPRALSAGLVQFDKGQVQFEGLVPQSADRTCESNGKSWPCGTVARTAFRNYLRARALVCTVPEKAWQGSFTTSCTLNGADPAAWLAENGWAEVTAGSPLEDKVAAARKAGLGFFGADPRDFSPNPVPLDETLPETGDDPGFKMDPDPASDITPI